MGLHKQADEYPRGAGRICNWLLRRETAALGIGPYNHDRKCGTRWKQVRSQGSSAALAKR